MKDDYTTNSDYINYTFLFRKVGRRYFLNSESERVKLRWRHVNVSVAETEISVKRTGPVLI